MTPNPLFKNDSKLEEIYKLEHSLLDFHKPENFKSYDELKTKMHRVLAAPMDGTTRNVMEQEESAPTPKFRSKPAPEAASDDGDDEDMEFFKKLASE
jgi:hypothetical protein